MSIRQLTTTTLVAFTLVAFTLVGCGTTMGAAPPPGGVYNKTRGVTANTNVEASDGPRPGSKKGKACAQGVLGLAAWGDMSLEKAKADAGITKVDTLDFEAFDILGVVYSKHCTVITGE